MAVSRGKRRGGKGRGAVGAMTAGSSRASGRSWRGTPGTRTRGLGLAGPSTGFDSDDILYSSSEDEDGDGDEDEDEEAQDSPAVPALDALDLKLMSEIDGYADMDENDKINYRAAYRLLRTKSVGVMSASPSASPSASRSHRVMAASAGASVPGSGSGSSLPARRSVHAGGSSPSSVIHEDSGMAVVAGSPRAAASTAGAASSADTAAAATREYTTGGPLTRPGASLSQLLKDTLEDEGMRSAVRGTLL